MSGVVVWREIAWRRPVAAEQVVQVLRLWAHDPRRPFVVLEARSEGGRVRHLVGASGRAIDSVTQSVLDTMPGSRLIEAEARLAVRSALRIRISGAAVPLRSEPTEMAVQSVLAALLRSGAVGVMQLLLGAPTRARLPRADGSTLTTAERTRASEPGFACLLRVGTSASHARLRPLVRALGALEAAGLSVSVRRERPTALSAVTLPWWWRTRLSVRDLPPLTCWPVGNGVLPGIRDIHPVQLPAVEQPERPEYIVGDSTAPGASVPLGMDTTGSLRHSLLLGPPGVGKSVLLAHLVLRDIELGHGVVLLEPKGDVVRDVLRRLPADRHRDVVVLDPAEAAPVGLNPLVGGSADVRAEALLGIFVDLFGDGVGPRSRDVLHHALLTMARHGGLSLPMLPLLLTNDHVRRTVTAPAVRDDPLALGAFWGWFEHLSVAERASVVAPVLNKVRLFTTNRALRAVIGQQHPRFSVQQVFSEKKILLVPLQAGVIGESAARLLGSLVLAEVWQSTLAQVRVPEAERPTVMVTVDELPQFVSGIADFPEMLALARGYRTGIRAALQALHQAPRPVRDALTEVVRSRIVFRTGHADAAVLSKGHPEINAEDFTRLGAYEVYAQLMLGNTPTPYMSGRTRPLPPATAHEAPLRAASRERWGQPRSVTEAELVEAAGLEPSSTPEAFGRRPNSRQGGNE